MKKILIGLLAVFMAAATALAVQSNEPTASFDPSYHWFDDQGQYLGFLSESSQRAVCDATTIIPCRNAYNAIDFDEQGNEIPEGNPVIELMKVN